MASETMLVPMLSECVGNYILYGLTALCAHPMVKALLMVGLALLNDVLTGNTTIALVARKEISCAILAQWVSSVVVE